MLDSNQVNKESFEKQKLRTARALSDRQAVCSGNLVQSCQPPDKFYNGWYPVRRCSFPGHGSNPPAGSCPSKGTTVFRNYRVLCEICDHPDNKQYEDKALDECKYFCCKKSSVAPKDIQPLASKTTKMNPCLPDTHWRFHDPRPLRPGGQVPAHCKVHKRDWFRSEMEDLNAMANVKKKLAQRERMDRLNEEREMFDKMKQRHKQREQTIIERQMSFPQLVPLPEKTPSSLLAVPTMPPKQSLHLTTENQEVE